MSKISTIFDRLNVLIPTLTGFTTKTKISNPYSLEDNTDILLKNGWGLKLLPGSSSDLQTFHEIGTVRQIAIVTTVQNISIGNNNALIDDKSKELAENINTLRLAFEGPNQLDIEASVNKVDYVSDSGIEFIIGEKFNFLAIEAVFNFDINETI